MSHPAQQEFVVWVAERFPEHFRQARVLEIGSLNVNGTVRVHFHDCEYLGVDLAPGPDVDLACRAHLLPLRGDVGLPFDTVISCEALEHDRHWRETLRAAVAMLRPGGLLVLTCAGPGRPEHGTRRTTPGDSATSQIEGWGDYYQNLSVEDLAEELPAAWFIWCEGRAARGGLDTQFWGIKAEMV